MQLIPPTIPRDMPSDGERLVFKLLGADEVGEAADGWAALHSQDIAHHVKQMEGEADFVVVAPGLGVLVLEVKGCRKLRRKNGLWYYGADAAGDPRGPFKQASEAMYSLRERVSKHRPHLGGVLFLSAVCFPFIEFTDESEEWHSWQVLDKVRLGQRSIADCVASALRQARERAAGLHKAWFDPSAAEPTKEQCDEVVRVLRPDFEYFESPKDRAKRIDAEILHYTELQFDALDAMRRMPRVVFDGPAGTGKTLLALEAARRGHAAGRRVLLLCFNRPLAEWLREQAAGVADAKTISDHMVGAAGIPAGSPKLSGGGEFWDVELPQMACDGLIERPDPYDELVVDEAQDVLRSQFLDVLDLSLDGGLRAGRWRLLGDFAHQAIYDDSVDLDGFCCDQGGGCAVFELDENCRNSPAVAALACAGGGIGGGYVRVMRTDDGDLPEVRYWEGVAQQQEMLCAALEDLRAAGFRGPKVAVLSTRKDAACVASTLTEQPWRDLLTPLTHSGPHGPAPDLHSGKTRYATVHRFKGLESRAVVLTDIERLSTPRERDLFYVGATRATQRLIVLAHESLRGKLQ
jgi:DNA polymerase III delta prime subunit